MLPISLIQHTAYLCSTPSGNILYSYLQQIHAKSQAVAEKADRTAAYNALINDHLDNNTLKQMVK